MLPPWFDIPPTEAQKRYDGPSRLQPFADVLPYIGEVVISFAWVERRLTWAIESLLRSPADEAYEMEDFVKNISSRIKFLELIARQEARISNKVAGLQDILTELLQANAFRNRLVHNTFTGTACKFDGTKIEEFAVMKGRYSHKPEKRSYQISLAEMRTAVESNLSLCTKIHAWVLSVRPDADNRMP